MKNKLFLVLLISFANLSVVSADPATTNGDWQWNNNVKIEFIYTYWDQPNIAAIKLDNGSFCHIRQGDNGLLSTVLSMHAQNKVGQFVCSAQSDMNIDGETSRRIHRIRH